MPVKELFTWTDGGARGNPGPAGYGVVICDADGQTLVEISEYIGETTNNQAEYMAVLTALEKVQELAGGEPVRVHMRLDSELVVKQLTGLYKIKNDGLKPIYWKIRDLVMLLGGAVEFQHIPRRENKRADELANEAMDRGTSGRVTR